MCVSFIIRFLREKNHPRSCIVFTLNSFNKNSFNAPKLSKHHWSLSSIIRMGLQGFLPSIFCFSHLHLSSLCSSSCLRLSSLSCLLCWKNNNFKPEQSLLIIIILMIMLKPTTTTTTTNNNNYYYCYYYMHEDHVMVKLDLSNAFYCLHRCNMLLAHELAVQQHLQLVIIRLKLLQTCSKIRTLVKALVCLSISASVNWCVIPTRLYSWSTVSVFNAT